LARHSRYRISLSKLCETKLQELFAPIEIEAFKEKFRGADFSLGFVISATRKRDTFVIDGPIFLKKPKGVDFIFPIPYRQIENTQERIDYVLDHIAEGIVNVLRKYDVPDSGIAQAVKEVANTVRDNPKEFEYVPKHAR